MRKLTGAVLILLISRIVGMVREFVIALAIGFSRLTDIFYQATWPVLALVTITNGPFTTAFSAVLAAAPLAERLSNSRYYMYAALKLGLGLAALFLLLTGLLYALGHHDIAGALLVLIPAAFSLTVTGYFYALATAFGWITLAALQLFVGNCGFVFGILVLWFCGVSIEYWTLPALFSGAMSLGFVLSVVIWKKIKATLPPDTAGARPLAGLGAGFLLAGLETSVFLLTQGLVVLLATAAGDGWLSATNLVQRVVFSVNGLIVSPFASLLMLQVVQPKGDIKTAFSKGVIKAALGLGLLALVLGGGLPLIAPMLARAQLIPHLEGIDKICSLLPSFSLWLVPMGLNIIVCRTMFGLKLDRLYTITTIAAYLIANLARLATFAIADLGMAIITGALIELIATSWLAWRTQHHIQTNRSGQ